MLKNSYLSLFGGAFACLFVADGMAATNAQISRLMTEKQQKLERLEQCTKKVKGFKVAGISTLGLTAVGIGGNIALASKEKKLETQIGKTESELEAQQRELSSLNQSIANKEQAKQEAEAKEAERIREAEAKEAERIRLENCKGNLWNAITSKCPNGCAAITKSAVCNYDLDTQKPNGGIAVSSDGTFLNFYGVNVVNSGNYMEFSARGCDCEKGQAGQENPSEAKGNDGSAATGEYEGILGGACAASTMAAMHVAKGSYVKANSNKNCFDNKTKTVVKCECQATECAAGYKNPPTAGLCNELDTTPGGDDKTTPDKNENLPALWSSCADTITNATKATYVETPGGKLQCLTTKEPKKPTACECKLTDCAQGFKPSGNVCDKEVPTNLVNRALGDDCVGTHLPKNAKSGKYKQDSKGAYTCWRAKDAKEDYTPCRCEITDCVSDDYELKNNVCEFIQGYDDGYVTGNGYDGVIGRECNVNTDDNLVYVWKKQKSIFGHKCSEGKSTVNCACMPTTQCKPALNMAYKMVYNASTKKCEQQVAVANVNLFSNQKSTNGFNITAPTTQQDNTYVAPNIKTYK